MAKRQAEEEIVGMLKAAEAEARAQAAVLAASEREAEVCKLRLTESARINPEDGDRVNPRCFRARG